MRLGEYIKHQRQIKGIKQKDLCRKLGYSSGQFCSNWERRMSFPPLKKANRLCDILGIDKKKYKAMLIKEFELKVQRIMG